jgi:hypothetical protein
LSAIPPLAGSAMGALAGRVTSVALGAWVGAGMVSSSRIKVPESGTACANTAALLNSNPLTAIKARQPVIFKVISLSYLQLLSD